MKRKLVKKFAAILTPRKANIKRHSVDLKRHKMYYVGVFRRFIKSARKKDWRWYYYYQSRLNGELREKALEIADECDYIDLRKSKY